MKKIFWSALALFSLYSCGGQKNDQSASGSTQEYPTMVLKEQQVELQSTFPVTIKGQEDIEIRPRIDGFIDAIYVDEGSVVKKGQTLFKINSPQAEQGLNSAKAMVNSAMASVNTAELNVNRIRPLAEKGIISEVQLQTYENSYQSALASLAQAKASLSQAQATMGWTNVSSPINGVVGIINFRQGSLVNSSNVLTVVSSTGNMYAYFSMNEKELLQFLENTNGNLQSEKIKNMPEVTLILADGKIYPDKGKIETISGIVDVTTGSTNLRVKFPNEKGLLRSGTSGKILIPRTVDNVFLIPQKATFAQQNKTFVYKVEGDSVLQKAVSVASTPDGKNYAVFDGLKTGDRIVADGIATLKNGRKIKLIN